MDGLNTEALGINRDALRRALAEWEAQARAGLTRSAEETRTLPVEQVADEGADALWGLLLRDQQGSAPRVLLSQDQLQKALHLFLVLIKEQMAEDVAASDVLPPAVVAERMQGYLWRLLVETVRFDSRMPATQGAQSDAPTSQTNT